MQVQTRDMMASTPSRRVRELIDEVVAAKENPEPFKGFLELTDVLLDMEVDGVRCVLVKTKPTTRAPLPALSPRELEIVRMVAKGLPNKSIASELRISAWTVSSHLRRVFGKLGVTSRTEMISKMLEEDIFAPRDED
ncbi:helix-turn-helix transcriptional regulator [Actinophytocola sp.]|uniref:helix-turn-helix domain-containing protein n=1 Tax=Actinophytocola sp. TaxID=1872138 RepID=UPI0038999E44